MITEILIIIQYNYFINNFFSSSVVETSKRFQCQKFIGIFPICTVNFSEASGTNFFNVIKTIIFIIFNKFFRDGIIYPINPLVRDLHFGVINFLCFLRKLSLYGFLFSKKNNL